MVSQRADNEVIERAIEKTLTLFAKSEEGKLSVFMQIMKDLGYTVDFLDKHITDFDL